MAQDQTIEGAPTVLYEVADHVATITLNRPAQRNALNWDAYDRLEKALRRAVTDPEARCVIVTGADPAFCSGDDVREIMAGPKAVSAASGGTLENRLMVWPSGLVRARNSPVRLNLKLVCSGWPGVARFFPEAKTTRNPPAGSGVGGNVHWAGRAGSSLRCQPFRSTAVSNGLCSSIQSCRVPSSSSRPVVFSATTSLILIPGDVWACAIRPAPSTIHKTISSLTPWF